MSKVGVIYKYDYPDGRCYVGQSWDMEQRHKSHLRGTKQLCDIEMSKQGVDSYTIIVSDIETQEQMNLYETFYLGYYRTHTSENGYNVHRFPNQQVDFTDDVRKKMSLTRTGMKQTDSQKRKRSETMKKKFQDTAYKERWLAARRNVSAETRRKRSETMKNRFAKGEGMIKCSHTGRFICKTNKNIV